MCYKCETKVIHVYKQSNKPIDTDSYQDGDDCYGDDLNRGCERTVPRAIMTISMESIKSVVMADLIFSFSIAMNYIFDGGVMKVYADLDKASLKEISKKTR